MSVGNVLPFLYILANSDNKNDDDDDDILQGQVLDRQITILLFIADWAALTLITSYVVTRE